MTWQKNITYRNSLRIHGEFHREHPRENRDINPCDILSKKSSCFCLALEFHPWHFKRLQYFFYLKYAATC